MAATWTSWISDLRRSTEAIEEENTLSSSISVVESVVKTHEDCKYRFNSHYLR